MTTPVRLFLSRCLFLAGTAALLGPGLAGAQGFVDRAVLTVYGSGAPNMGFAWVEERREFELARGPNRVVWSPLPRAAETASVALEPEAVGVELRNQVLSFVYPLTHSDDGLQRFVGRTVVVEPREGGGRTYTGTLVQVGPPLVLRDPEGTLQVLPEVSRWEIREPGAVPDHLAVIWEVDAGAAAKVPVVARYVTDELDWHAEYTATLLPGTKGNQGTLELTGDFVIENRTELAWNHATVRLVAGVVRRQRGEGRSVARAQKEFGLAVAAEAGPSVQTVGEYYEFALPHAVSLPAKGQVRLRGIGPFVQVPYEQEYVCRNRNLEWLAGRPSPVTEREPGAGHALPVEVFLKLQNDKASRLGMPLPAGTIRVGQRREGTGGWAFLGEGALPHTAANELVSLALGVAFDVVAERKQLDFELANAEHRMEEEVAVVVRNQKQQPVQVLVLEPLFRASAWEVIQSQPAYEKKDAHTIAFSLLVPARGRSEAKYRVRYRW